MCYNNFLPEIATFVATAEPQSFDTLVSKASNVEIHIARQKTTTKIQVGEKKNEGKKTFKKGESMANFIKMDKKNDGGKGKEETRRLTLKERKEVKYTFDDEDVETILDELLAAKAIKLPEPKCPAEVGDDNEETQVPETQIEGDNNPTPNENDSNLTVIKNNNTEATSSTQATMNKRKGRSPASEHFENKEIRGQMKAVCIHCKNILGASSKNGTRRLLDHVKSCLYKRQRTVDQSMLNPTKLSDGTVKLGTYNFDHDHARKKLANMIILHEYPLSIVDYIGFKMYFNALQPLFKVCSRNTIKKDIFKVFKLEREKTMKLLDTNKSRIAITTDMWTSNNQKRGFMTITSHFIDDAWNLQSRLIRFIYVPCPHTVEVLANALLECMFEWNLDLQFRETILQSEIPLVTNLVQHKAKSSRVRVFHKYENLNKFTESLGQAKQAPKHNSSLVTINPAISALFKLEMPQFYPFSKLSMA
ncbi:hypothetical protein L3X38_018264 [Prunus dulcis]|uniref:BED-type domain-containing protein n=1 Tax=Prunus dulcis TaxID=3755 RepID=A0AAD4Z9Y0_PRUDU|nr:hypothetical protein L3X38_018264 [Prunus dulcis]